MLPSKPSTPLAGQYLTHTLQCLPEATPFKFDVFTSIVLILKVEGRAVRRWRTEWPPRMPPQPPRCCGSAQNWGLSYDNGEIDQAEARERNICDFFLLKKYVCCKYSEKNRRIGKNCWKAIGKLFQKKEWKSIPIMRSHKPFLKAPSLDGVLPSTSVPYQRLDLHGSIALYLPSSPITNRGYSPSLTTLVQHETKLNHWLDLSFTILHHGLNHYGDPSFLRSLCCTQPTNLNRSARTCSFQGAVAPWAPAAKTWLRVVVWSDAPTYDSSSICL